MKEGRKEIYGKNEGFVRRKGERFKVTMFLRDEVLHTQS